MSIMVDEVKIFFRKTNNWIMSRQTRKVKHSLGMDGVILEREEPVCVVKNDGSWKTYDFNRGQPKLKVKKDSSTLQMIVEEDNELAKDVYFNNILVFSNMRNAHGRSVKVPYFESPPKPSATQPTVPAPVYHKPVRGKTRVLFFTSGTQIGGQERALLRLLRSLDKNQYQLDVAVTHTKGVLHGEFAKYASNINYCDSLREDVKQFMLDSVRGVDYDYIHFFNLWTYYDVIPEMHRVKPESRIIATLMVNFHHFKVSWIKEIERIQRIYPCLYALTTDSYVNVKVFPKITVIRNGVPADMFSPKPKKPKSVVWLSRLSPSKKPIYMVDIANRLPEYDFTLIGDAPSEESEKIEQYKIRNLTVKYGLTERQVADVLAETQYLVFTSLTESMPISILEAMASECCVISESVGDIPSVIHEGVNGYLVPKDVNVPVWIASNLPSLNVNAGKNARKTILHGFTEDQTAKQFEFLYGNIGSHRRETRVAFIWGVLPPHGVEFWDTKVDSHQEAIKELGKNNAVQVFVPTNVVPTRKILNGQNMVYYDYRSVPDMLAKLERFKPDMIFMNMFHDERWMPLVSQFRNVWKALFHYGEKNLAVPIADAINLFIVQQNYLRSEVAQANNVPLNRVVAMPFCLEEWLFKIIKSKKKYTGIMVADFREEVKRQHLLIEAWRDIPGILVLVGYYLRSLPKDYHDQCKALAYKLGVSDRIIFIDGYPHERLPELINEAKIGFLTSAWEGGSRSLIEQMACGLPEIVLSDCKGTINMIRNGVDGYIADPNPQIIAEKAELLLKNYASMGEVASKHVREEYPYHRMTKQYASLVMGNRPEVSVITTSMNRGRFLKMNIKSVLNQTWKAKINHIIMDGGSTDNTPSILEEYSNQIYAFVNRDSGQTDAIIKAYEIIENEFPQTMYVGWINADDCVSEDTEILTDSGWKTYDQISVGENILTFDHKSENLIYQPIQRIVCYPYKGIMINLKSKSIDALLTPRHRVLQQRYDTPRRKYKDYEFRFAINSKPYTRIPVAGIFEGNSNGFSDDFIRLLAWVITEGNISIQHSKLKDCRTICIVQSEVNVPYVQEIRQVIEIINKEIMIVGSNGKYGGIISREGDQFSLISRRGKKHYIKGYNEHTTSGKNGRVHTFHLSDKISQKIINTLINGIHFIPRTLLNLSQRQLNILYDTLMKGDGSIREYTTRVSKQPRKGGSNFVQKREKTIDSFQELCIKIGKRSVKARNTNGLYTASISNKNWVQLSKPRNINKILYEGIVWCVTVENSTWIARRNGRIFITGNCYQADWLEKSITSLSMSAPDVAMSCADAYQVKENCEPLQTLGYTSEPFMTLKLLGARGNIVIQPTVLIKMEALKQIKKKTGMTWNPEYHYCQDLELWVRFLTNGYKIMKLNKGCLANLRSHPQQMSITHQEQQILERDRILRKVCELAGLPQIVWMRK